MAYPFSRKAWENTPSTATPISAAALTDVEDRLAIYSERNVNLVTALPTGADRFTGRQVAYKPAGAALSPVLNLMWDGALNAGSGAWACLGGAIYVAGTGGSMTVINSTTWTTVTDHGGVTLPVAGIWRFTMYSYVYHRAAYSVGNYGMAIGTGTPAQFRGSYRATYIDDQTELTQEIDPAVFSAGLYRFRSRREAGTGNIEVGTSGILATPLELRP